MRFFTAITHGACQKLHKFGFSPQHLSNANVTDIEIQLHPVGFYKTKAKHLKQISKILVDKYNNDIPKSFDKLVKLPGLGPKMSNYLRIYSLKIIFILHFHHSTLFFKGHIIMKLAWNETTGIGVS
jgi:endonuclease III